MAASDERVVIADLTRPRGNRGEVIAISQTDVPDRLATLRSARVRLADGRDQTVEIVSAWRHRDDWVLKFLGVDSINQAEPFRGGELWITRAERGRLSDGDYFQSDLVGFGLVNVSSMDRFGTVTGWQKFGGAPLLEAQCGEREVMIPFVPEICLSVDLDKQEIAVRLPEGLLDL